ncbi:hypothetical protein JCM12178A_24950 [Salidesulfovibrio brasiliensis]
MNLSYTCNVYNTINQTIHTQLTHTYVTLNDPFSTHRQLSLRRDITLYATIHYELSIKFEKPG